MNPADSGELDVPAPWMFVVQDAAGVLTIVCATPYAKMLAEHKVFGTELPPDIAFYETSGSPTLYEQATAPDVKEVRVELRPHDDPCWQPVPAAKLAAIPHVVGRVRVRARSGRATRVRGRRQARAPDRLDDDPEPPVARGRR